MNENEDEARELRELIVEGEKSGPPVEIDAESFLNLSRKDRLQVLRHELTKGEQGTFTDGPVDLDALNAEIDKHCK